MKRICSNLLSTVYCLLSFAPSQKGQSSIYIIIVVIVIIFAVMMAGGGGSLFSGNEPSSAPSSTPTPPPAGGSANATATPASSNNPAWTIEVTLGACEPGKVPSKKGTAKIKGPTTGTVDLIIGTTNYGPQSFAPPEKSFPITLSNDSGANTTDWKIVVTSGGQIQKTYEGVKTGC